METIFGIKWPTATFYDIGIIIFLLLFTILIYTAVRLFQVKKKQELNSQQLFLFKIKQLGLTTFQVKIINNMISAIDLKDRIIILENPDLFDQAIGKFLAFLASQKEGEDSLMSIGKEIIVMHEKLYHPNVYQKKLELLSDIQIDTLFTIMTNEKNIYIGKLLTRNGGRISLQLFRHPRKIQDLMDKNVNVMFWRAGDAEYSFKSKILSISKSSIEIAIPEEFTRGKEVRHPYIDTITPCSILENSKEIETEKTRKKKEDKNELHRATMYKLNEHEAIIRTKDKLDYQKDYTIEFEISEFKMNIQALIIADRTIREETLFYYTFRFRRMSEAAHKILSAYIVERLS